MLFYEPKKTDKADLEKKRPLIFSISLVITMSLLVLAFEYKQYDNTKIELVSRSTMESEEIIEIPPTDIPPPPPPATVVQPQIVEVPDEEEIKDEIKVEFDVEVTEQTKVVEFAVFERPVIEKEDPEEIFLVVEQTAVPKGGMEAFYKYVNERLKYPAQARRMQIQGRVFIEFVVDRDGSITNVIVVKGIGAGCDEEAQRIVQGSPPWAPGKQRGKPVRQRMVLPITFKLADPI